MRRKTSAVAMLTEPCQGTRLAKTTPGRNARCAGKEPLNADETKLTVNSSPSSEINNSRSDAASQNTVTDRSSVVCRLE